jgi:iron-sulfur cluster assembly accessory protein
MRLSLTAKAAGAVLKRAREAEVEGWLLRVAVVSGGCNGLSYDLYFVEAPGQDDAVVDAGAFRIAVDPKSAGFLEGTEIDLAKDGFVFKNPRARKRCSCGASFEV